MLFFQTFQNCICWKNKKNKKEFRAFLITLRFFLDWKPRIWKWKALFQFYKFGLHSLCHSYMQGWKLCLIKLQKTAFFLRKSKKEKCDYNFNPFSYLHDKTPAFVKIIPKSKFIFFWIAFSQSWKLSFYTKPSK